MSRKRIVIAAAILLIVVAGVAALLVVNRARGPRSVADVLAKYGPGARARLKPFFTRAKVQYPPKRLALLVFKDEKRVAVWADGRFIRAYPVLAASGHAGPKLREGDSQVPEGLYRISGLNPNSSYHLSMRISYPNPFDLRKAALDGRTRLGGDIFMHGKALSIGCVAVGDPAIEELFTLVAETTLPRTNVIIAPNDLRARGAILHEESPRWTAELYRAIAAALAQYPLWMESDRTIGVDGMSKARQVLK
ncbi:MAG TPA: L,D-transpeptidase family protein [Thermoanaerobaculia bacterium]|nr:L,D-transpeptidase family protein [Thermoanaerobaculia bacterium]